MMSTATQPLTTRPAQVRADTTDSAGRTIEAVISTENAVTVYDHATGNLIDERLLVDGLEDVDQVCLLLDHRREIPATIGSVSHFRKQPPDVVATLHFASNIEAADNAWELVSQRHSKDVSVGYRVLEATLIRAGETVVVAGRSFTASAHRDLSIVTRWEIREISLTPIGADVAAKVRSVREGTYTRSNESDSMETQTLPEIIGDRNVDAMSLNDFYTAYLRSRDQEVPPNYRDVFRAGTSSVDGVNALLGVVNQAVLGGFHSASDSMAGVYATQNLPNYLLQPLAQLGDYPRPGVIPRGGTAPHMEFSLDAKTGYRCARLGLQFSIDEQDAEDTKSIGLLTISQREGGASFRRMLNDLLWTIPLLNANLADGTALFHADRGNYVTGGGSALSESTLDTALAAIADQTAPDVDSDPVHLGLQPRFLIVPPNLFGLAKRLVRNMSTGSDDLHVRKESRLSSTGFVDPTTDTVIEPTGTAWMLASHESQGPGIVLGALFGKVEPTVRSFKLKAGEWGIGFDMSLSVAVAAVDGRPLYWSDGQ